MLDTVLTDLVSDNVQNEVQEIEIISDITLEEYVLLKGYFDIWKINLKKFKDLTFQNATTNGVQEVQEVRINSTAKAPFVLAFDGAYTGKIQF